MNNIKYLVMDVDGTLTDGKIYMGNDGEIMKAFDIKDGYAIHNILVDKKITPIIITGRKSTIVELRCKELGITNVYQGIGNKLEVLKSVVSDLSSVAYAGDDIPDLQCMKEIKNAGGVVLAPSNAVPEIKAIADYISSYKAGDGAMRDCIEFLIRYNQFSYDKIIRDKIQNTIELLLAEDYEGVDAGVHILHNGIKYMLQVYETKDEKDCVLESHRNHIDIQIIINGREYLKTYSTNCLVGNNNYNNEKDLEIWKDGIEETQSLLVPGSVIVIYNGKPHKGAIRVNQKESVKKIVCKIDVSNISKH